MVVKYLERFVEDEVPGGFYPASLEELIRDRITKHGKATVVMDASSAAILFYRDLDSICNGQLKSLRRNVEKFVKTLESWGAELIVFYPGTSEYQDLMSWKGKRLGKLESIFKAFDRMYRGENVKKVEIQLNAAHIVVKNTFLSIKSNCKVFTSTRECDEEVAEFARDNKGVVVLAQDSDYIIYDGIECYASMKSLNLDSLECHVYDRKQLAAHLNLETADLPLLATLSGNEVISEFSLRSFHAHLCGRKPRERIFERKIVFRAIADFILKNRDLTSIGRTVARFGITEKSIRDSLDMYSKGKNRPEPDVDPSEAEVLEIARERTRLCLLSPAAYSVLYKKEFRTNNDLEDFRDGKAKPIARILRPLRQKIYGILLNDSDKTTVVEYCVEGAKQRGVYVIDGFEIEAEKPRTDHPGLLRLWQQDESSETESAKFALFCEAAGIDLDLEEIRSVPPKFLFPTVALHYLCHVSGDPVFRDREAETFLTTALLVSGAEPDSLEKIESGRPNPRAVRLSSLFLRCCGALQILNQACGFVVSEEDSCPSNYFDGKMFQMVYAKTEAGESYRDLLQGETSLVILLKTLLAIVHSN